MANKVSTLKDVAVPNKYFNRLCTGVQELDEVFGGAEMPGILPGASVLMTGFPGAGKSTMSLQMAEFLREENKANVLYNAGEENQYMIKMRYDRLGLNSDFSISSFEDLQELCKYCVENRIEVLFQDSLQTLVSGDLEGRALTRHAGKTLAKLANEHDITIFIVGQITKGGDFAGPMAIKHYVDAHCHMSFDKDTGNRIFELTKNRFGPAMIPYEFIMGSEGLDFRQVEDPESRREKNTARAKKEAFIAKAKELLLNGQALSGYSHTDHSGLAQWIDKEYSGQCSGNWWRGILAKAVNELERENHVVKKFTENRREHVRVEA